MYFPNDVLIERCALSAMNREPQTLDEIMTDEDKTFSSYEKSPPFAGHLHLRRE